MASALGDIDLVRRYLDADPACIRMSVSEMWFPKRDARAGGSIYTWTLGANKTAHAMAHEFGHEELFRLLMERSPARLKLALACELGEEGLVREMLASQPDLVVNLTEPDRRRLADAAQGNNTKAVRTMLEAGWPADARGQHRGTALHWACFHGNAEMARELIRHRAPLDAKDNDFNGTPLGWAIHGSENGWHCQTGDYAGTVKALLEAGAKPPENIDGSDTVMDVLQRWKG
jgi:ankyrin repeat protein